MFSENVIPNRMIVRDFMILASSLDLVIKEKERMTQRELADQKTSKKP